MTDLLTEKEAAARLDMGERTLREIRYQGGISYCLMGKRKIRYRPQDCEDYLASRVRVAPSLPASAPGRTGKAARGHRHTGNVVVPFSQRAR